MKIWVFSGGGSKIIHHIGAADYLIDQGEFPDIVIGSSAGALMGAGIAHGGIKGLKDLVFSIKKKSDILSLNWWNIFWARGIYSMKPLRKIVSEKVNANPKASCEAIACQINLYTGEVEYVSNKYVKVKNYIEAVMGSSSIPGIMEPQGNDDQYADGGIREQSPLKKAFEIGGKGAEVTVFLANPFRENPGPWKKPGRFLAFYKYAMRALDIMEHEVFLNDLKHCHLPFTLIAPTKIVRDTLDFESDWQKGYEMGRESARKPVIK